MGLCRPEELVKSFHHGGDALLRQRPHHTGEGRKSMCARGVLRALRHFASDHSRAQRPLGSVVRRLNVRVLQEAQQVAPIMVPTNLIEQPLIVRIRQTAVAQVMGDRGPQALDLGGEIHRSRPCFAHRANRLAPPAVVICDPARYERATPAQCTRNGGTNADAK